MPNHRSFFFGDGNTELKCVGEKQMNKVKSDTFRKSRTKLLISGYFSVHVRETHDFVSVLNYKMCEAISQSKPFKQGRTLPTVKTSK